MIVASCEKCNSTDLDPISLHGWNSNQGTFQKECIYCNNCCSMLEIKDMTYIQIGKIDLLKYMINE